MSELNSGQPTEERIAPVYDIKTGRILGGLTTTAWETAPPPDLIAPVLYMEKHVDRLVSDTKSVEYDFGWREVMMPDNVVSIGDYRNRQEIQLICHEVLNRPSEKFESSTSKRHRNNRRITHPYELL